MSHRAHIQVDGGIVCFSRVVGVGVDDLSMQVAAEPHCTYSSEVRVRCL